MHELSHLFGVWITGANVIDYQLMPKFWEGDYKTGFIRTDYSSSLQEFIVVIVPYLRDIILLFVGLILVKKLNISSHLLNGLIIIMLILSPIYDIINNYFSFILGSLNDFNALKNYAGSFGSNFIGISFTIFAITINILAFRIHVEKNKNELKTFNKSETQNEF
jgi:hypothetical protein